MKKYNFKLIFACVFLGASLILFACGNFGKIFLMFACFCLSASMVLFAFDKQDKDKVSIKAIQDEIDELNLEEDELKNYTKFQKKTQNRINRMQIGLFAGAALLIILGVCLMI